jgi:hypothetical protein
MDYCLSQYSCAFILLCITPKPQLKRFQIDFEYLKKILLHQLIDEGTYVTLLGKLKFIVLTEAICNQI